jgi:hypothetical protein
MSDVYRGRDGEPHAYPHKAEPAFVPNWANVDYYSQRLYAELTGRKIPQAPEGAAPEHKATAYALVAAFAVLADVAVEAVDVESERYDGLLESALNNANRVLDQIDAERVQTQVVSAAIKSETRIPAESWSALLDVVRAVAPVVGDILLGGKRASS